MTQFDDMMAETVDDLFALYGQVITYTPKGGDPVSITGVKGSDQTDVESDDVGRFQENIADLTIAVDPSIGVAVPVPGDTVTINSVVWQVDSIIVQDGTTAKLQIRKTTDLRKHSEQQYKRKAGS